jgi:PTS system mannose-specific IIB component
VATTITKMVNPDRIIVCSDAVAHDDLRKSMIEQAAPPGVKAHVVPIWKIVEVSKDPRFGDTRAMLLFETPQDLERALEGGVEIKEVNLGSMAHSLGKVVVTNAVAMDQADVDCLERIAARGVKVEVYKVPADSHESLDAVLKKAKAEIAAQK